MDIHDIVPGDDWRKRLGILITGSEKVIFLISKDSVASEICDWEVNEAERQGKPIIPVMVRKANLDLVPPRLTRLNIIFYQSNEERSENFSKVVDSINIDFVWEREKTRVNDLARAWEAKDRPARLLAIREDAVQAMETWRESQPVSAAAPTELQREFITASRAARRHRSRLQLAGALVITMFAIALAGVAFSQRQAAVRSEARSTRVLAASDFQQGTSFVNDPNRYSEGLALLSRSVRNGDNRSLTRLWTFFQQRRFWVSLDPELEHSPKTSNHNEPQADGSSGLAAELLQGRFKSVELNGKTHNTKSLDVSADGQVIFTTVGDIDEAIEPRWRLLRKDGQAITDWLAPPYDGDNYVYDLQGTLSPSGKYLALVVSGWREPSMVYVFDVEGKKWLGRPLKASGNSPQSQNAIFNIVRFLPAHRSAPEGLLLLGSVRGDATVLDMAYPSTWPSARSSHDKTVSTLSVDDEYEWMMSSAVDGSLSIRDIHSNQPIGQQLNVQVAPENIQRSSKHEVVVKFDVGEKRFSLMGTGSLRISDRRSSSPIEIAPVCLRFSEGFGRSKVISKDEDEKLLSNDNGSTLERVGPRTLRVRHGTEQSREVRLSADIAFACFDDSGDLIVISRTDFKVEVWDGKLVRRVAPIIDEASVFSVGQTPVEAMEAIVAGDLVVLRSFRWVPPNLELWWISLWDLSTGLPLMDRIPLGGDDAPSYVQLSPDGSRLLFFTDEAFNESSSKHYLKLRPSEQKDATRIADIAEAVGGITFDAQGAPTSVSNRNDQIRDGLEFLNSEVFR